MCIDMFDKYIMIMGLLFYVHVGEYHFVYFLILCASVLECIKIENLHKI